jgi:hypothetical protein
VRGGNWGPKFAKILFFDYSRPLNKILGLLAMTGSFKIRNLKLKTERPFVNLRPTLGSAVVFSLVYKPVSPTQTEAQTGLTQVRTANSALSAGIGTLWLTQEQNIFKKHGLDSSLIYIRRGTTAVQALLAGEIQFGHLSPAPMMAAWAQGADFVWIGTTTHQMVFTLFGDASVSKGVDLKGKKIGNYRLGSASDLAVRAALEQYMAALTEGAKIYKEDSRAALRVLRKYLRAEDRILESGYKEYDQAISSPPYSGLKGLEALRESLLHSTPQLKQVDLRKFIDDRFVRTN